MTPPDFTMLCPDLPLVKPETDRFGYAALAKNLADSISRNTVAEGLVIGVHGSWGHGKSTLLNFTEHYLLNGELTARPIIIRFNPWWFSGREDLMLRFFDQLQSGLSEFETSKNNLKEIANSLADYMDALAEAPIPHYSILKPLAKWFHSFSKPKNLTKLKQALVKQLQKQNKTILVIIDDLDRLTSEEIKTMFGVVKAVADFPKMVYLLAFDKTVVAKALNDLHLSGESYLEKIVQLPIELPLPDRFSLEILLFEKIDIIFGDQRKTSFEKERWEVLYFKGIKYLITSPRDIIRLTNALFVSWQAIKDEVNPFDFIAIEALRIFLPNLYDIIRKNQKFFTGIADEQGYFGMKPEVLKLFHEAWLKEVRETYGEIYRSSAKQIMISLFPLLETIWENTAPHQPSAKLEWRKSSRVCSPEYFDVYFRLAVPEWGIKNSEMKALLALSTNSDAFYEKLTELVKQKRPDGATRAAAFLDKLEDYTEELRSHFGKELPHDSEIPIVKALLKAGDELLRSEINYADE